MGMVLITPPLTSPVSIEEARRQCRIHSSDTSYDAELQVYIDAAVSHVEETLSIVLEPQVYDLYLDAFSDAIEIPLRPVISIDEVAYVGSDGTEVEIDAGNYTADLVSSSAWVVRNGSYTWPTPLSAVNVVRVRFTAGYEGELDSATYTSGVPAGLRQAVLLLVGHWFTHRTAVVVGSTELVSVPLAFDALVQPYKRPVIA